MEPRLFVCVLALAPLMRNGTIIDAGANDGTTTAMLASALPAGRFEFLSIEPVRFNVARLRAVARNLSASARITVVHGGIGSAPGIDHYPSLLDHAPDKHSSLSLQKVSAGFVSSYASMLRRLTPTADVSRSNTSSFRVHTIDGLFDPARTPHAWPHRRLAFAHIDVEGAELEVLLGGRATIERDRPPMTVETFPRVRKKAHTRLVETLAAELQYAVFEIDEPCGWPPDCRNLLCVPSINVDLVEVVQQCPYSTRIA